VLLIAVHGSNESAFRTSLAANADAVAGGSHLCRLVLPTLGVGHTSQAYAHGVQLTLLSTERRSIVLRNNGCVRLPARCVASHHRP
jgi:hypothetical protein